MKVAIKKLVVLGVVLAGFSFAAQPVEASHFRFGHITWIPRPDISPTTAEFKVKTAWRRSFTFGSAPDGRVAVGDLFPLINSQFSLAWGDGSFSGSVPSVVLSIDTVSDWFLAETSGLIHTYPAVNNAGVPWRVEISGCCRIYSPQRNAPGTSYTIQTTVDLGVAGGDSSPESTIFPIVNMAVNTLNTITLPVAEVDGDTLNCRLATFSESFISNQPGPPTPGPVNALSVSTVPGGCVVTWQTAGTALGELWATSLMIEQSRGGQPPHSKVGLEFLIRIVGTVGMPPVCDVPPTPSGTVTVPVGLPFSATVQGSDPDAGDVLTLNTSGIPAGSTISPSLPTIGPSPISATFSWTPTTSDVGPHPLLFSITDTSGQQALCSSTLDVKLAFDPFGGIKRTPTRGITLTLNRPSSDSEGVRCIETTDPNNPDFTGVPFTPFGPDDQITIDFLLSMGIGLKTICCEFIDIFDVITGPLCSSIELTEPPRSKGFWTHQCSDRGFHQVDPAELEDLVLEVESRSDAFTECTSSSGCDLLESNPPMSQMRKKAEIQHMALWLNVASRRLLEDTEISFPSLTTAETVGDAIAEIEATLCDPGATGVQLENAKNLAEALNVNGEDMELASTASELVVTTGAGSTVFLGLINMSPVARSYELRVASPWPATLSRNLVFGLGPGEVEVVTMSFAVPTGLTIGDLALIQVTATDVDSETQLTRQATIEAVVGAIGGGGQKRQVTVRDSQ